MIEFIFGFICAVVIIVAVLPIISRWLMKLFIKRKMNLLTGSIGANLMNLSNKLQDMQDGREEKDKTGPETNGRKDNGSERDPNGSTETGS